MRLSNEELQEKIDLTDKESNDLEKIEQEKRQFNALQDWSKKPRYQMPETILERAKRWLQDVFSDKPSICKIHGVEYREHGFEGFWDCPECRIERYEVIKQMK